MRFSVRLFRVLFMLGTFMAGVAFVSSGVAFASSGVAVDDSRTAGRVTGRVKNAATGAAIAAMDGAMESTVAPMAASGKRATRKQVQKQWQHLLDQTLPLATSQIARTASFYPFAAVQYGDGQIRIVSAQDNQSTVAPAAALQFLRKEIATLARNGRLQAVVYYADAVVDRKDTGLRQTGIRLKLDHATGESMEGFLPYLRENDGSLKLLTPEYRPAKNVTFR